jgi:hypothetical protein
MSLDALPEVTLRYAEQLRRYVWEQCPTTAKRPYYDHQTKSYPPDASGSCRHKVEWLRRRLGGQMLVGRRTDQANPELHAVLAVRIGGQHLIAIDADGLWPWPAFRKRWRPELHEPPPPAPEPKPAPARGTGWHSRKG